MYVYIEIYIHTYIHTYCVYVYTYSTASTVSHVGHETQVLDLSAGTSNSNS